MPFAAYPGPPLPTAFERITAALDPVLVPLGFAAGQSGASGARGQVIFCRGLAGSTDGGCVDLVLDVEADPAWRITDVRWWGHPSDRWHLAFPADEPLPSQLDDLARTLPDQLA